jgi:hypothetical protein
LASRHGNIADEHLPVSAMTKADSNNIMTTSKHMQPVAFLLPTGKAHPSLQVINSIPHDPCVYDWVML